MEPQDLEMPDFTEYNPEVSTLLTVWISGHLDNTKHLIFWLFNTKQLNFRHFNTNSKKFTVNFFSGEQGVHSPFPANYDYAIRFPKTAEDSEYYRRFLKISKELNPKNFDLIPPLYSYDQKWPCFYAFRKQNPTSLL